jgi:hypothetical protein
MGEGNFVEKDLIAVFEQSLEQAKVVLAEFPLQGSLNFVFGIDRAGLRV